MTIRTAAMPILLLLAAFAASPLAAQTTVEPGDYGKWESLRGTTLSPDGTWAAVTVARVDEKNELRIRPVANPDSVIVVEYGSSATFSEDGRWLAYGVGVSQEERERMEKAKKPVRQKLGLVDLSNGTTTTVDAVASFSFSPDGRYLAMRRYPPQGDREARGVDLVLRDLVGGTDTNFGNVAELSWQDEAPLLALLVDAEGMAGNGVQLYDAASGRLATLDSKMARYRGLLWREDGYDLAVLREVVEEAVEEAVEEVVEEAGEDREGDGDGKPEWADTAQVALAFTGLDRGAGAVVRHELTTTTTGFPADHRVVPFQDLRWSEDGATLFLGVRERVKAPGTCPEAKGGGAGGAGGPPVEDAPEDGPEDAPADTATSTGDDDCGEEEDEPTVEIWHAGDVDIVPTQKVRAGRDRMENHLTAWRLRDDRVVQLEDGELESVQLVEGARHAVGLDETPWAAESMFGPVYRDVHLVDVATGERKKALERVQYFYGMSPGGRYLLYMEGDHYRTYDTETGRTARLTDDLPTSFVDLEDDHTVEQKPPFGPGGWLEDDEAVLLYDEYDVWRVAPDGSGGERLTRGTESNVRHRRVWLDRDERAIDPEGPIYFSLYDDWAEASGYGRMDELGDEVERLVWEEARVYGLEKAEEAEVYVYTVEDFADSPDVFAGGPELRGARQLTRTNPFQSDYLWGRAELVTYTNAWGDTLQGSLYYPAGWEAGKRYPMITYIYEIRSNAVRSYQVPSERNYYNMQTWVQDGYFVFQPDIVYRDRDPGVSAVANIIPAVEAVLATGMVDPEQVGLIGHSWGGYQTAFVATQTDIFNAAVAGAPLTNLFSMYLSVYWNSGSTDARIFEISQGRMEVPFWEDEDAYKRNSPVFHVENLNTPLLMAQGTEDGAVDFNQGVEYYNAARRAGKPMVFLVYNGENHGFREEANQKDYHRRINQWFAHYLKGEPAPDWIEKGVPYLEQPGGRTARGGG